MGTTITITVTEGIIPPTAVPNSIITIPILEKEHHMPLLQMNQNQISNSFGLIQGAIIYSEATRDYFDIMSEHNG